MVLDSTSSIMSLAGRSAIEVVDAGRLQTWLGMSAARRWGWGC
jgi:hypothetical protein